MSTVSIKSVCEPNLIAIKSILEWYRLNTTPGRRSFARRARRLLKQTIQSGRDKSPYWSRTAGRETCSRASVCEPDVAKNAVGEVSPVGQAGIPASVDLSSNIAQDAQISPSDRSEAGGLPELHREMSAVGSPVYTPSDIEGGVSHSEEHHSNVDVDLTGAQLAAAMRAAAQEIQSVTDCDMTSTLEPQLQPLTADMATGNEILAEVQDQYQMGRATTNECANACDDVTDRPAVDCDRVATSIGANVEDDYSGDFEVAKLLVRGLVEKLVCAEVEDSACSVGTPCEETRRSRTGSLKSQLSVSTEASLIGKSEKKQQPTTERMDPKQLAELMQKAMIEAKKQKMQKKASNRKKHERDQAKHATAPSTVQLE